MFVSNITFFLFQVAVCLLCIVVSSEGTRPTVSFMVCKNLNLKVFSSNFVYCSDTLTYQHMPRFIAIVDCTHVHHIHYTKIGCLLHTHTQKNLADTVSCC